MVASFFTSFFVTARWKSTREEAKRVAMFAYIISCKRLSVPCCRSILSSGDNELRGCIVLIVISCKLRVRSGGWKVIKSKTSSVPHRKASFYATMSGEIPISEPFS